MWGLGTVELLLVQLYLFEREAQELSYKIQVFDRLYEIAYMSSIGAITKESGSGYLRSMRKVREELLKTMSNGSIVKQSTGKSEEQKKAEEKSGDENKVKYLEAMKEMGNFGSMQQVLAARKALNEIITENGKK